MVVLEVRCMIRLWRVPSVTWTEVRQSSGLVGRVFRFGRQEGHEHKEHGLRMLVYQRKRIDIKSMCIASKEFVDLLTTLSSSVDKRCISTACWHEKGSPHTPACNPFTWLNVQGRQKKIKSTKNLVNKSYSPFHYLSHSLTRNGAEGMGDLPGSLGAASTKPLYAFLWFSLDWKFVQGKKEMEQSDAGL